MENIISSIRKLYPVSDDAIDLLASNLTEQLFAPKEIIMRAEHRYKKTFLIEQGITGSSLLVNGRYLDFSSSSILTETIENY